MAIRKKPVQDVETQILVRSRRRCALCFGLRGDLEEKRGQIAHVDRNSANSAAENLCYLCLEHHDLYDSGHSQSKGFTPAELRHYREALYADIEKFEIRPAERATDRPPEVIFLTLHGNSFSAGVLDVVLKNDSTAFTILTFEAATPGASIQQWHPRSLSHGDLLRAPTSLPNSQPAECIFHMKIRDRAGNERVFQVLVDIRQSPPRYDFVEVGETTVGGAVTVLGRRATRLVERDPAELDRKRALISEWRKMIVDINARTPEPDTAQSLLQSHPGFLSLEPHLSEDARRAAYGRNFTVMAGVHMPYPLYVIKNDISRIEKSWGLIE